MAVPRELLIAYIRSATDKLASLEQLWNESDKDDISRHATLGLIELSHRLAGSGGSYGFHELGEAARALELELKAQAEPGRKTGGEIELAYRALHRQLEALAATPIPE